MFEGAGVRPVTPSDPATHLLDPAGEAGDSQDRPPLSNHGGPKREEEKRRDLSLEKVDAH